MNSFETEKGTVLPLINLKGKAYLQVAHRLVWFREVCPDWGLETEFLSVSPDETIARCVVKNEQGRIIATAHKREDRKGFADHSEKAETGAIGRALALCGFGTQFAEELDEGERLADAPTQTINRNNNKPIQKVQEFVSKTGPNTGTDSGRGNDLGSDQAGPRNPSGAGSQASGIPASLKIKTGETESFQEAIGTRIPTPKAEAGQTTGEQEQKEKTRPSPIDRRKTLMGIAEAARWPGQLVAERMQVMFHKNTVIELTDQEYDTLVDTVKRNPMKD